MAEQMPSNLGNSLSREYLFSLKRIAPFASRKFEVEASFAPVCK